MSAWFPPGGCDARSIRRNMALGLAMSFLLLGTIGGWASVAQLAGAVIAPGLLVVESNVKRVQHPTGGVLGQLNVREGDVVRAGDVLARLDATLARASLQLVSKQLDQAAGRVARLIAERDGLSEIVFPAGLVARAGTDDEAAAVIDGESRLFRARRMAMEGQKAQLRERILQSRREIDGLDAQQTAKGREIALIEDELAGVLALFERNLVQINRLKHLQREAARLGGERGQIVAAIAQVRGRIAETELQIIQLDQNRRTEVMQELRDYEARIGEYVERRTAAQDQLARIDIRAPQDGIVHQLDVHTVGGVVSAGQVMMLIVPRSDELVVEARVSPGDIDQVTPDQMAVVRFSAFSQRTTPELAGIVTSVAPDLLTVAATGEAFYKVRIHIAPDELARLRGLRLVPGMPVEVHIRTGSRSALSYMLKPLADQLARAFREE
ncbi:HlyD family type I secretion periplasmic adaptor subunit [Chelatococcus daeguensis]|uniref:Membrane fusion protein (MFP) family protein n=3 Tax=Chelatococcus TaxID=28209 RepID=A0AAC9NXI2_9HYPH|nr:HlyD family type I secretion periplasmic adaptor subunit [Chelatococcus daeguensis]APF36307.1 hemolysin secretion protein D [Chelatococcus daeguensis]KZE30630.1 hemolysin secretion protein D [Chelatococcus daeguensis]MBM3081992.1 HlyD family type I secretion periplasmic adaptor subunit [Chelatococcus daeguensis]CUA89044.1 type I secretion membrane fusion protein, HlyD family [Chelatococcus sambhunathii]